MKIKELFESWIVDLVSSVLGVAMVVYSFEIKQQNPYWWIAFISGLIFQIPLIYFKIWKFIEENFG
ncbi:hypothetical protein HYX02_04975 [Candidatus Woesearchaeota archaeon]|nr:hypothetical protein [Candidatus Woesearchaeota archaeon]